MKIISISQTLAVWQVDKNQKIGKFSSFFEPNFASQKSHHRISKIPTAQIYFSRRFKICNLILPSLLGNGRINMYFERFWGIFFSIFSKFNPSDRRGRSQFKISPIPWLEHIPMEHLWEKSWQIHCKTNKKKWSFGVPELKKSNFKRFFDIFGLVREVRQFKNKLKLWFKTALLFSLVSYPNFF